MSVRTDPATIGAMADELRKCTDRLGQAKPAPPADLGPSSGAVSAMVAQLFRTAAGLAETTANTAADLDANKATYVTTEDENKGMFERMDPR